MEIVQQQLKGQTVTDISTYFTIDVDRFYGIEYEEFPAQIAQVAMWLIDHQMNMKASETFGEYYVRLPLRKSATIVHANALRIDWQSLLIKETTTSIHAEKANIILNEAQPVYKTVNVYAKEVEFVKADDVKPVSDVGFDYIMGNPPFGGSKFLNENQQEDMLIVGKEVPNIGTLDYVIGWYIKAVQLIKNTNVKAAFVSTNSITQGEQAINFGSWFIAQNIQINFAHKTFQWTNEAKGMAAVHCVIIGFSYPNNSKKFIYDYKEIKGEPYLIEASNINPYLVNAPNILALARSSPISKVPPILNGSIPADGGNLILSEEEKWELILKEPQSKDFIRQYVGAEDFIQNKKRFCLWLIDCPPDILRQMPTILKRIDEVKKMREASAKIPTRRKAATPTLFTENRQPRVGGYLAIPRTSSENRSYIPIGFLDSDIIAANDLQIVPNASKYHFGVLISAMHMAWVKLTAGRLKSDIRYSAKFCYNNFPWPEAPTDKQTKAVEEAAQAVLDARAQFPNSSLADLYDPNTMPPALVKAHQQLDKAVDLCYRPQPFPNETKRIEFLFELYDKYTAGLFVKEKKKKISAETKKHMLDKMNSTGPGRFINKKEENDDV
jgi:hypothetical protein